MLEVWDGRLALHDAGHHRLAGVEGQDADGVVVVPVGDGVVFGIHTLPVDSEDDASRRLACDTHTPSGRRRFLQ